MKRDITAPRMEEVVHGAVPMQVISTNLRFFTNCLLGTQFAAVRKFI